MSLMRIVIDDELCEGNAECMKIAPEVFVVGDDDRDHRKRRALVNAGFTPRRVQAREARVREVSIALLERAKTRGRFDFVHDVSAWLPLIVIGDMLGVEEADHERLLEWSDGMLV